MAEITNKMFLDYAGLGTYTTKVKDFVNSSVSALKTDLEALIKAVSDDINGEVTDKLDALDSSLKDLSTNFKNHVSAYTTKVGEIDGSIGTLKSAKTVLDASVSALETWKPKVDSSLTALDSSVAKLREDVGDCTAVASSLVELITTLQNNHVADTSNINGSIGELKSAKTVLDASVSALEVWKVDVDSSISGVKTSVTALDTSVKNHETRVKAAEDAIVAANSSITALKEAVLGTEGGKSLSELIEAADTSINALESSVEDLDASVANFEPRIKANEDAIAKLNADANTAGSVAYQVSAGVTLAVNKVLDGAGDSFDTLKEVQTWIENHGTDAANLTTAVNALEATVGKAAEGENPASGLVGEVAALKAAVGDGGSVDDKIDAAVAEVEETISDLSTNVAGIKSDVDTLKGDETTAGSVKKTVKDAIDAKVTELDLDNTYAKKTAFDALVTKVGDAKAGETAATGIYLYVDNAVAALETKVEASFVRIEDASINALFA